MSRLDNSKAELFDMSYWMRKGQTKNVATSSLNDGFVSAADMNKEADGEADFCFV